MTTNTKTDEDTFIADLIQARDQIQLLNKIQDSLYENLRAKYSDRVDEDGYTFDFCFNNYGDIESFKK